MLEEVLDASIALLDADFGSVQLYDEATGTLLVVAQRGFTREFLDYFGRLHEGTAPGEPAPRRDRIIVEDVRTDPLFAPHVDVVSAAGYRALQSTPMLGNRGQVLGVISTHFQHPHRPSERELRFADLYARQAATMIERKRAEEKLRQSEAYLAEAQRLSHTGSWAWNASNGELFWSLEHFRICGVDPENFELTIETAQELIHPEDRASSNQAFWKATSEGSDFDSDLRMVRPDGTIRYVHSLAHPVFNESGVLVEYVGTIIDVTDRKQAAEKAEAAEKAKREQELKSAFLDALAHSIKSPLASTKIAVTTLLLNRKLEADQRELLSSINRNVDRLNTWTTDTIRAVSLEAGIKALNKGRHNIAEAVHRIVAEMAPDLASTPVDLQIADGSCEVEFDLDMLKHVLRLLLDNARKYSPAGSPVVISCHDDGERAILSVKDAGRGIPADEQDLIFEKYYRGRTSSEIPGTGLGLAISRTIVRAHGGELWVDSEAGHGSTFRLSLPHAR